MHHPLFAQCPPRPDQLALRRIANDHFIVKQLPWPLVHVAHCVFLTWDNAMQHVRPDRARRAVGHMGGRTVTPAIALLDQSCVVAQPIVCLHGGSEGCDRVVCIAVIMLDEGRNHARERRRTIR
jgi:hypothetical protein